MMNTLIESLLLACTGVLLAWLLRRPARRLAGPGPAFCLWSLPLLLAAMPCLPTWSTISPSNTPLLVLPTMLVLPQPTTSATDIPVWLCIWLGGCALMLLRLALYYLRIVHAMRPLPMAMRKALAPHPCAREGKRLRLHPAGPAVLWSWRCRVLLPADFLERFDAGERAQVLAHEFTHLRRGDPLWSLAAELALAALWFFPPAWLAMSRFRLDQELACDAAVLRNAPATAGNYARTLLGSIQARAMPTTNPWLSKPQLKERLTMIHRHQPGRLRRLGGYAGLGMLLAGVALATQAALPRPGAPMAQATTSTAGVEPASVDMSFRARHPPRYPKEAIKNHAQGTVVLKVLVDVHGKPLRTEIATSSGHKSLDQAAVNAAMQWRFNPGVHDGKPVKSWAKIPVAFRLHPAEPADMARSSIRMVRAVPTPEKNNPPAYPASAIKNHEQGTIALNVLVDAQGNAGKVNYDPEHSTSDSQSLIQAAIAAAKGWKFTPATKNGKPVEHWVRIPVKFALPKYNAAQKQTAPIILLHPPASAASSSN